MKHGQGEPSSFFAIITSTQKQASSSVLFCFVWCVGFAFIYMEDERDAEDAIRGLDRKEFGRQGRRLRVEWTKVIYKM